MRGGGLTSLQARLARASVALVVLGALAVSGLSAGALQGFRRSAQDALHPRGTVDERVVVIAIDADALEVVGVPWPWPRPVHAKLLRALHGAGAAGIGVDILFAEPAEGDEELAAAMRAAPPVVLAAVPSGLAPGSHQLLRAVALAEPHAGFSGTITAHAVLTEDIADGVARRVPMAIEDPEGRFLPSLALALAAAGDGDGGGGGAPPIIRPDAVQVGDRAVPTGRSHELIVSYGASPHVVSAGRVLRGGLGPGELAGKLVLVGVTDPTLGDRHRTPMAKAVGDAGVLVQAQATSTILGGRFLRSSGTRETATASILLAAVVLFASQLWLLRAAALVTALALAGYIALVSLRFDAGTQMDPLYPPLVAVVALVGGVALRYGTETRQRKRIAGLFGRYVPEAVAAELLADEGRARGAVEGHRLRVAVLFCDLRGFTSLAAGLTPPDVRRVLDAYYLHVTTEVLARGGSVMQFVGDEVFAVFGAPLPMECAERSAVECALAVQAGEPRLHEQLAEQGLPVVHYGISVHAGDVVAAHVGTDRRRQYAVVGDTVNVGSRLCGVAGPGSVVASAEIEQWCRPMAGFQRLGTVTLHGVAVPMPIWASGDVRVPVTALEG